MAQLQSSDLISRARRGDDAAWEMLVRDHQEAIFRLAYLLLGDAHDAGECRAGRFCARFSSPQYFRHHALAASLASPNNNQSRAQPPSFGGTLHGHGKEGH